MYHSLYKSSTLSEREESERGLLAVSGVLIGVVLAFFLGALIDALDAPEVYVSYPSGKCVKVVSPEGERPCQPGDENKYERVWVE